MHVVISIYIDFLDEAPSGEIFFHSLEAVSQFEIPTKRSPDRAVYRKISIQYRKKSNYGTSS
jgi:hypothetical protein